MNNDPSVSKECVGATPIMEERADHDNNDNNIHFPFWYRPRLLYTSIFIWISITGGRFLASFLEQEASLSPTAIGSLLAVQDFTGILTSSIAGMFADWMERRYPRRGRLLVVAIGSTGGSIFFCLHGCSRIFVSIPFFTSIIWYMLLRILFAICTSLIFPVVDGICLDFLKRYATEEEYGKERLFGAISWAITHLALGPLVDHYQNFVIFYFLGIAAAMLMLLTLTVYSTNNNQTIAGNNHHFKRRTSDLVTTNDSDGRMDLEDNNKHDGGHTRKRSCLSFLALFGSSCFTITFLIARVTLASGQAVVDKMVFLFFEFLGSSFTLMSCTVVLTVVFEIPIFHVAPKILEAIGASGMLLLGSFSYVTRVIGYTLIPAGKAPLVLLFEPLHGVTYACSQSSGVDFASKLIPEPGMEATGQGLLQFFVGAGSALGLFFGGILEDAYGPNVMYRIFAFVVFVGNAIFAISLIRSGRLSDDKGKEEWKNKIRHQALPQEESDGVLEMTPSMSTSSLEEH